MSNPLEKHLANAFADFEGLRITGSIPLREEMLNEIIADVLQNGVPSPPAPAGAAPSVAPTTAPRPKVDMNVLLGRVKSARVRFEAGRAVLDFDIGV